jgi:hypothetical protein
MKYSFFHLTMLAAVAIVMGACQKGPVSQDPDPQEQAQKEEKVIRFWDVVGQLVAASDITDDYKGKTFEPVIGVQDASNQQARIVATNSAAAAAKSFANLIGVDTIDENTTTYPWTHDEIGKLTYTKLDGSTAWAEVKVEIPSVPHLSKIIYRSAKQGDTNASFRGSAYYRFGDVIGINRDNNEMEYWVCVRPAFSPEGKGDTHWMSIGNLPEKNIWHYKGSNNKDYYFPTKLKYNKEHMQNLAELLYALCFPNQWQENIVYYSTEGTFGPGGLPIFHDFHKDNIKYHNANFWNNVAAAWRQQGIDQTLFGRSLDNIAQDIESSGLHFLYNGYSWWTSTSNYATVYQGKFVNGTETHANMQTDKPYTEQKVQMIYKNQPQKDVDFDVRNTKSVNNLPFFGDSSPRYILRYAKGSELSETGKYSDVHEAIPGVWEIYRYYRDVLPVEDEELASHEPEITTEKLVNNPQQQDISNFNGIAHYRVGNVYTDESNNYWFVLIMSGTDNDEDNVCEKSPYSELVSFTGLLRPFGTSSMSGLPTYDQAARAMTMLNNLFTNAFTNYDRDKPMNELPVAPRLVRFVDETAKVDIMHLFQLVAPVSGYPRNYTHMCGFAYSDPAINSTAQPVGRFLYPIDLDNEKPPFYFWKHYPSKPDVITQTYVAFSDEPIVLQDVASAEKVAKYAPDLYATKGFHPDQATHGQTEDPRSIRSTVETRALTPESYCYDYAKWNVYDYPTDMWNEPVLMFRVDAVYDRGTEYANITVGGRKLTLVKEFPLVAIDVQTEQERKEFEQDAIDALYSYKGANWRDRNSGTTYLDGVQYLIPDWRTAWRK